MLTKFCLALTLLYLTNCSSSQPLSQEEVCSKERAVEIAKKRFKRKGYDEEYHDLKVEEDSLSYIVKYELDLTKAYVGGGAEITISKQDCSIVDQKFYQ